MRATTFVIQRGLDQRWYVSYPGSGLRSFRTQVEAEEFAKRLAKANQPSIVRVEITKGRVEKEWNFGEETPGIRWQSRC